MSDRRPPSHAFWQGFWVGIIFFGSWLVTFALAYLGYVTIPSWIP